MKLKNKMLITILTPVILVILTLSLVSYRYSKNLLIEESKETMSTLVKKYSSDIETILSENIAYVEISANTIEKSDFKEETLLNDLKYLTENVKGTLGFFLGFTDKKFIDGTGWVPDANFDPTTRDWFKNALDSDNVIISPPYINAMNKTMIVTISKKVRRNNQPVGALGSDVSMKELENLVKSIKIEDSGKAYLLDGKGNFMIHDSLTLSDNIENLDTTPGKSFSKKLLNDSDSVFIDSSVGEKRIYAKYPIKGTEWTLVFYAPEKEVVKASGNLARFMGIIGFVSTMLLILVVFLIASSITKPILRLSSCVESMVDYDFTLSEQSPSVIYSKRKDEIGIISRSLIKVKETIKGIIININDIANQVSASSEELTATSDQTASLAESIAYAVGDISKNASLQDETMQNGDQAMKVMAQELLSNQEIIENLNTQTNAVVTAKENGISTISELVNSTEQAKASSINIMAVISGTNEKAIAISSASDMIKSIADQTNLLALNAAIEAARAGEAGKGFAVVAEEIRKLAEQSNTFTEEIKDIVTDLTSKTSEAVEIMTSVGKIVENQGDKVSETKEQFFAISEAIDKNQTEIEKLNRSKEELESTKLSLLSIIDTLTELSGNNLMSTKEAAESTEQQTASSEEVASASANLSSLAQDMIHMISNFKI